MVTAANYVGIIAKARVLAVKRVSTHVRFVFASEEAIDNFLTGRQGLDVRGIRPVGIFIDIGEMKVVADTYEVLLYGGRRIGCSGIAKIFFVRQGFLYWQNLSWAVSNQASVLRKFPSPDE